MKKEKDERFDISEDYRQKVLENYVDSSGKVSVIPSKEKKKIVLLEELIKQFSLSTQYTEREVNEIISEMTVDYASVRRYLVEYGFLSRTNDGKTYWVV